MGNRSIIRLKVKTFRPKLGPNIIILDQKMSIIIKLDSKSTHFDLLFMGNYPYFEAKKWLKVSKNRPK